MDCAIYLLFVFLGPCSPGLRCGWRGKTVLPLNRTNLNTIFCVE
jgi:hypothetical protein